MTRPPIPDAIVFDLDGTLIDSVPDVTASLNKMLAARKARALDLSEVKDLVGYGVGYLIRKGCERAGVPVADDSDLDAAVTTYKTHYQNAPADHTTIYPGVEAGLGRLHHQGVLLGICTNKPHGLSETVLSALGLDRFFNTIIGGDRCDFPKPDARHVQAVLQQMGAGGKSAVMVGDSETDMEAGRNADLPVIAVNWGYPHGSVDDLHADRVISRFDQLPDALAAVCSTPKD